jgi:hypothetical protein
MVTPGRRQGILTLPSSFGREDDQIQKTHNRDNRAFAIFSPAPDAAPDEPN